MLDVTLTEGCLMAVDSPKELFRFEFFAFNSKIRPTNVHNWVVTYLKLILDPSFITVDIFAIFVILIYSYVFCLLFFLTFMTE